MFNAQCHYKRVEVGRLKEDLGAYGVRNIPCCKQAPEPQPTTYQIRAGINSRLKKSKSGNVCVEVLWEKRWVVCLGERDPMFWERRPLCMVLAPYISVTTAEIVKQYTRYVCPVSEESHHEGDPSLCMNVTIETDFPNIGSKQSRCNANLQRPVVEGGPSLTDLLGMEKRVRDNRLVFNKQTDPVEVYRYLSGCFEDPFGEFMTKDMKISDMNKLKFKLEDLYPLCVMHILSRWLYWKEQVKDPWDRGSYPSDIQEYFGDPTDPLPFYWMMKVDELILHTHG